MSSTKSIVIGVVLGWIPLIGASAASIPEATAKGGPLNGAPKLGIVISVDQLRADYLVRFRPYFGEGGFKRLLEEGIDFAECHHRHAFTITAPGHATILTGVHADVHGIIANDWLGQNNFERINAVGDSTVKIVGEPTQTAVMIAEGNAQKPGRSPTRLLAPTLGDELKLRYGSACRVISVANKDRAAILLGGRLADGVYWSNTSRFVTSTYYRPDLPEWVNAFNAEERVAKDFNREWTEILPPEVYDLIQGPDRAAGEEQGNGLGGEFPRLINGGGTEIGPRFYSAHTLSPFTTEWLAEFVKRAVRGEELGRHAAPDLLCIGFSQIDYLGHAYGPDSHEVMDAVIRLDRVLADLFSFFDREIGKKEYVVVLTADHGVAPLPERLQAFNRGLNAARMDWPALNAAVEQALVTAFGAAPEGGYWTVRDGCGYRLNPRTLDAKAVAAKDAQGVLKAALLRSPQVAAAFTRNELLESSASGDLPIDAFRRSFNAERSPEVLLLQKPYLVDRAVGSNHGTLYDYDSHVPLLWYGAGIAAGVRLEPVATEDIAPTLAALLHIPRPPQAKGRRLF